jgi:hypothetical protein
MTCLPAPPGLNVWLKVDIDLAFVWLKGSTIQYVSLSEDDMLACQEGWALHRKDLHKLSWLSGYARSL